jgi:hypothetical protein
MSTLALVLADFTTQLPFSNKIEDRQIQPFVALSRTLDLTPLLGSATLEAVDALATPGTVTPYATDMSYLVDGLVSRRERIYRAVGAPTTAPPTDGKTTAEWADEPLLTLWLLYLKPWWVQQSFARFLSQHGLDITKAGVTQAIDRSQGSYDRPSTATRAELQASVDITAEALKSRLTRFLRAEHLLYTSCGCGYNYYPDECGTVSHTTRRHNRRFRAV